MELHCSCCLLQVDAEAASGASPTSAAAVTVVETLPAVAPLLSEQAPLTHPTSSSPAAADDDLGLVSN